MGTITSAFADSAKSEFFQSGHNFNASAAPTGTTSNTAFTVTAMSSNAGVCVGMAVSGTGIAAGTVVASIDSASQITLSKAATASGTVTLTFTGDVFKMALFRANASLAGSYSQTTTNYTDMTGNSDEASGTGYTPTGTALTNVSATVSSHVALVTFSPNPSWTTATFTTAGCMIYNTSVRVGGTSGTNTTGGGRNIAVFDFGGDQTVSGGTLSVLMPAATNVAAVLRIS